MGKEWWCQVMLKSYEQRLPHNPVLLFQSATNLSFFPSLCSPLALLVAPRLLRLLPCYSHLLVTFLQLASPSPLLWECVQETRGAREEYRGHTQQETGAGWHLSCLACGCSHMQPSEQVVTLNKEIMKIKAITRLMQEHSKMSKPQSEVVK